MHRVAFLLARGARCCLVNPVRYPRGYYIAFVAAFVRMNETRTKTHAIRELTRGEVPKIETM